MVLIHTHTKSHWLAFWYNKEDNFHADIIVNSDNPTIIRVDYIGDYCKDLPESFIKAIKPILSQQITQLLNQELNGNLHTHTELSHIIQNIVGQINIIACVKYKYFV